MKALEINRELVLSTAHMPYALAVELDEQDDQSFVYGVVDHGYMLYVQRSRDLTLDLFPGPIRQAVKLAQDNDCKWLRFDGDGPYVEDLPKYHWEF